MIKLVNKLKNRKGFTLIELIVVLAVLAIILAIAVPRFVGVKDQAKIDADKSTLDLIAKTAEFYYAQGMVDSTYSDTKLGTTSKLAVALAKDFPGLTFQTDNKTLSDVIIKFDTNGKATATK